MALTTFHERLLADAVLPTTLRTLLELTDADSVYDGRRRGFAKLPREVLVEDALSELRTPGAGDELHTHRYTVRIRRRVVGDAKQRGAAQKLIAKADVIRVVRGLNGTRPWVTELEGDVVAVEAKERTIDEVPGDKLATEAIVDLVVVTRGSGDVDDTPFDPATVSGLVLWLDANDAATLTVDASNRVESWASKAGVFSVGQAVEARRPILTDGRQNDLPGVVFTRASQHYLSALTTPIGAAPWTLIVVAKTKNAIATPQALVYMPGANPNTDVHVLYFSAAPEMAFGSVAWSVEPFGADTILFDGAAADTALVLSLRAVADDDRRVAVNGTDQGTSAVSVSPDVTQFHLGGEQGVFNNFDGDIYEVLAWDRVLSTAERQLIEAWLMSEDRWGIA